MVPVLSPENPREPDTVTSTFRAPRALVAEIDEAAESIGLSRNKAILQLLRFALDAHWKETGKKGRK